MFGLNVSVKLDLFHAVQRKTRTLSKKHTLTQCCTHELCLVFRCDGDSGKKRVSATPSPEALLAKLELFIAKWQNMADGSGVEVFTSHTVSALNNLKHHIMTGCCSSIPPGGGTSRNE